MAKWSDAPRSPEGGRRIACRAGGSGSWAPPNKRMHATRDTSDFIYNQRGWRARDARR
ncbi:MAG: hypothetical protein M3362_01555 [Acidobacteriota bacterium]|nr:hypothetical protein [Acidobacteriota bacterium]